MSKEIPVQPRYSANRTLLLLVGSLILLSACAQLPTSPDARDTAVPSSSQAADGPQTAAWSM